MKKVLFIGNSFTYFNDLPKMLEEISEGLLSCDSVTMGGAYLHEYADPEHELGQQVRKKTKEFWDAVILQEQSFNPIGNQQDFVDSAGVVAGLFPGSAIYMYQTWSYEEGTEKLETTGLTFAEMTKKLKVAYEIAAEAVGGVCVPVGSGFAKAVNLDPEIKLYVPEDNYHPLPTGSYIAACMFYQVLTGNGIENLKLAEGVTEKEGMILKQAVTEA